MKKFLLSLALVVSSTLAVAEEVPTQVSFGDQMINHAGHFVERTVNLIATPFLSDKDVECLARNIFYESGGEPLEGKVAVGVVTLNRTQDPKYPQTVCGVVHQKTTLTVPTKVTTVKTVPVGILSIQKQVEETRTVYIKKNVYQFSWVGQRKIKIRPDDPRWIESKQVAEELARGGYEHWQEKYATAMNFHAIYVRPGWKLKRIGRVGNHIFYEGPQGVQQGG